MKIIQKVIYAGFAAVAIASAAMPVLSMAAPLAPRTTLYGPDFEWYAQVGRPTATIDVYEADLPQRPGAIWSPGHWEWDGYRHRWVIGHWIKDDYADQLAMYNLGPGSRLALTPDGALVAYEPAPIPIDTLRR
jgi:hypothetical protein